MPALNEIDMDTIAKVAGGLVGGGGLAALVSALISRGRTEAEGGKLEAEAALIEARTRKLESEIEPDAVAVKMLVELIRSLNEQIKQSDEREKIFQDRVRAMDDEIRRLRIANTELESQVIALKAIVNRHERKMTGPDPFAPMMRDINQEREKTS